MDSFRSNVTRRVYVCANDVYASRFVRVVSICRSHIINIHEHGVACQHTANTYADNNLARRNYSIAWKRAVSYVPRVVTTTGPHVPLIMRE